MNEVVIALNSISNEFNSMESVWRQRYNERAFSEDFAIQNYRKHPEIGHDDSRIQMWRGRNKKRRNTGLDAA